MLTPLKAWEPINSMVVLVTDMIEIAIFHDVRTRLRRDTEDLLWDGMVSITHDYVQGLLERKEV